jgi:hypothetical protein
LKKTFAAKIAAILFVTFLTTGIVSIFDHSEASAYYVSNLKDNHSNNSSDDSLSTSTLINQNKNQSLEPNFELDAEMKKISLGFLEEFKRQIKTRGNIKEEDYNELFTIIIEGKTIQLENEIKEIVKELNYLGLKDKFTITKKSQKKIDAKILKNKIILEEKQKEYFLSGQLLKEAKAKENEENKTKKVEQAINAF